MKKALQYINKKDVGFLIMYVCYNVGTILNADDLKQQHSEAKADEEPIDEEFLVQEKRRKCMRWIW